MPSYQNNSPFDYLPDESKDPLYINDQRKHYYIESNSVIRHPHVSPLFATESSVPLCRTLIHVGDAERLLDENVVFWNRFKNSPVQLEIYEDMVHVFQVFGIVDRFSVLALKRLGAFVEQTTKERDQAFPRQCQWIRSNGNVKEIPDSIALVHHSRDMLQSVGKWDEKREATLQDLLRPIVKIDEIPEIAPSV